MCAERLAHFKGEIMTALRLSDGIIKDEILVVGLASKQSVREVSIKEAKTNLVIENGDVALDTKKLLAILADMGATGKCDEVIKIPGFSTRLLVFTGLGEYKVKYEDETLRRAAGAAARALAGNSSITLSLPAKRAAAIGAIGEGALLGSYIFNKFRVDSLNQGHQKLKSVTVHSSLAEDPAAKAAIKRASIIGEYTALVRDLINTPPSHLNPESFCADIAEAVKKAGGASIGLKVSVLNEKQLRAKGFGGITAVGQGSINPPRLLQISYTPVKVESRKSYAYVGKGITFDTGGLALKPAAGMEAMKSDMSGAAAVCAATIAIALLKIPVKIDCYAPLAENMVSENATRPSDIITMYGGKTIEVLNPDAEGRLVLGDALVKAQENIGLDGIVDVATLTGAQVVALGTRTSAIMTNNQIFSDHFFAISKSVGEAFWPMPLPIELRASLDSPVADMANIGERMGGMMVAGLFLKEFISPELPWLHLDIAGPAYNEGDPYGYTPVGGTGISLRSLVALAEAGGIS
jgi:leucyl aminopeptidase